MSLEYCDICDEQFCEACDCWEECMRCKNTFCEACVEGANFNSDSECEDCCIGPDIEAAIESDIEADKVAAEEEKKNGTN
tara:strand:- start:1058 stop:1297 length:240 start_codon:yes stop_codon:yes gene_type:complete